MTFILNVLHKDFSIIASDTQGSAEGPVTVRAPGLTITLKNGSTIHGIQKMYQSKSKKLALGIAGNIRSHAYTKHVGEADDHKSVLKLIQNHAINFLSTDYSFILTNPRLMKNAVIVTYQEQKTGTFFTNYFAFDEVHNFTHLYAGGATARLIHAGSGSGVFEKSVGLSEINQFCAATLDVSDIPMCVQWMARAYNKVSQIDKGSNDQMIAIGATKDKPTFNVV